MNEAVLEDFPDGLCRGRRAGLPLRCRVREKRRPLLRSCCKVGKVFLKVGRVVDCGDGGVAAASVPHGEERKGQGGGTEPKQKSELDGMWIQMKTPTVYLGMDGWFS